MPQLRVTLGPNAFPIWGEKEDRSFQGRTQARQVEGLQAPPASQPRGGGIWSRGKPVLPSGGRPCGEEEAAALGTGAWPQTPPGAAPASPSVPQPPAHSDSRDFHGGAWAPPLQRLPWPTSLGPLLPVTVWMGAGTCPAPPSCGQEAHTRRSPSAVSGALLSLVPFYR